ncbi:hypothetical protein, conserved [Trypanosoma brucei brucei TREU927]|uniref:Pseudouridine synthase RsuA/RluA-like domain-containing protein n=2 Tax=Trypanozoon TaxID=39700 RepID=Q57Z98_TRYB2|nr:hypothetical protein, conserved [Trypanosoma brucei brucei TREU927]AAX80250.1 hypothetical protein, conserved [Trypanosoma brucei]AAZ10248.1 hypothetical protein, conserved [Trypanosoma brucei brucei TREU927]
MFVKKKVVVLLRSNFLKPFPFPSLPASTLPIDFSASLPMQIPPLFFFYFLNREHCLINGLKCSQHLRWRKRGLQGVLFSFSRMHHARGLVRRSSTAILRKLEGLSAPHGVSTCFLDASFIDGSGTRVKLQLLHTAALLQVLSELPKTEALAHVREAKRISAASLSPSSLTFGTEALFNVEQRAPLFVKRSAAAAVAELASRQSRFLSKVEGRLMAHDLKLVEAFTKELLQKGGKYTDNEIAQYRGVVEELSKLNPAAALAMAMNAELPSLGSAAATALARLVRLDKPAAVLSFLEGFAAKDEVAPASETCATQVAIRLRNRLWGLGDATATATSRTSPAPDACATASAVQERTAVRESIVVACRFNIDPSIVFPTDAAAIQRWSCQFLSDTMWPLERAEVITDVICRKRLLPRRVAVDCLSNWCLTDLERPWFSSAFAIGGAGETNTQAEREVSTNVDEAVVYCTALSCALKDPKRNLVDNRLLLQYAKLLSEGELDPSHSSFPHFIEECGESHSDLERPAEISFLLQLTDRSVMEQLLALAPHCSYWRTLLEKRPECADIGAAPEGHMRVVVRLPPEHECVRAAETMRAGDPLKSPLPIFPVVYEDDDLLVINKPPHVATSRHALSCSQLCDDKATDIVSLQLTCKKRGDVMRRVFRQGQVHRLDTETSGCLIMAKSDVAASSLRHQMGTSAAYSQSSKIYLALCAVVESNLTNIPLNGVLRDPADAKITTKYRIVHFYKRFRVALVEARIQQGKKHQIRRHLAAVGLPILQDVEHGGAACCSPLLQRVALHASSVTVVHPRTAEVLTCVAPLPEDMRSAIFRLSCE